MLTKSIFPAFGVSSRVALVSAYLSESGAALTSLRTRASLEERYFDLIADSSVTVEP